MSDSCSVYRFSGAVRRYSYRMLGFTTGILYLKYIVSVSLALLSGALFRIIPVVAPERASLRLTYLCHIGAAAWVSRLKTR